MALILWLWRVLYVVVVIRLSELGRGALSWWGSRKVMLAPWSSSDWERERSLNYTDTSWFLVNDFFQP